MIILPLPTPVDKPQSTHALTVVLPARRAKASPPWRVDGRSERADAGQPLGSADDQRLLPPPALERQALSFCLSPTYVVVTNHHPERDDQPADSAQRDARRLRTANGSVGESVGDRSIRAAALEPTDQRVPSAYWQCRDTQPERALAMIGGHGFTVVRVAGVGWRIAKVVWSHAKAVAPESSAAASAALPVAMPASAPHRAPQLTGAFETAIAHSPDPTYPPAYGLNAMSDEAAWSTPVHFGTNQGVWLRDLSEASREWYFDVWFAEREKDARLLKPRDLPLYSALHRLVRGGQEEIANATTPLVRSGDEGQPAVTAFEQLGALMQADGINERELTYYLCQKRTTCHSAASLP